MLERRKHQAKKAFGKVYELSDLTLPDEYDRRGQVYDRDETITVFHGTNAEGAKRILESKFAWINTNMRDIDGILDVHTDPHEVIEVKSRNGEAKKSIGLLGLLTEDPSLYRPGAFGGARIDPVLEYTETYMKEVMDPLGLDLVIPFTHQRMGPDREFAKKFTGDVFRK